MPYPRGAHRLSGGRNYRRVVETRQNDATGTGSGSSGTPAATAPVNTVAPVVSGTAVVGQTLSCTTGTWTGTATITYTYQWQHGTTNISGKTSSTYVIEGAYAGETIRCVVTGTNGAGSSSANSNATSVVKTSATFGKTVVGGSSNSTGPDFIIASKYTLSDSGATAQSMAVYLFGTAVGAKGRMALYTDVAGTPTALVGTTAEVACNPAGVAQWFTASFPSPISISAGDYWLTFWLGGGTLSRVLDSPGTLKYSADTYSTLSNPNDPFNVGGTVNENFSIYCTYLH